MRPEQSGKGRLTAASIALEGGTRFLLANQGRDGLWRDFLTPAGEASEWTSGFVAAALQLAGADASVLARAAHALVAGQHEDGGWGYNADVPSDADSTACVLLFLARMGHRADSCRRAASCLIRHQRENGGVATYDEPGPIRRFMGVGRWMRFKGWCSPQVEVTATAGCALATLSPADPAVGDAWSYVRSRQRADGSWSPYWWTSAHYSTLRAAELALARDDRRAGPSRSRLGDADAIRRRRLGRFGCLAFRLRNRALPVDPAVRGRARTTRRACDLDSGQAPGGGRRLVQPSDHADPGPGGYGS